MQKYELNEIEAQVTELLKDYCATAFLHLSQSEELQPLEILQLLVTDSLHAITFIVLLENEFDIEIDDDDISYEFFESIEKVSSSIFKSITQKL
ncbi:MAG: phosphopantetheine-binding protein [Odoribacter sp.]|nr:phosphopantetheine-binding protein [Odoribacter sp.]